MIVTQVLSCPQSTSNLLATLVGTTTVGLTTVGALTLTAFSLVTTVTAFSLVLITTSSITTIHSWHFILLS